VLVTTVLQPPASFLATMEEYIREAPRPSIKSEVSASPFEKQVLDLFCFVTLDAPKAGERGAEATDL